MRQHLDEQDPFGDHLVWTEAAIDDGQLATTFYYRNVIDCVRFLIRQVAYRYQRWSTRLCGNTIQVGSDYTRRCIQRTGGGIRRYEICHGPDICKCALFPVLTVNCIS